MKKIIFLILLVLFTTKSFSQGVDLGIKVGANFATLTDDVETRTGLNFGAFATIKFNDKIALQGDLLYSQQGAELLDIGKVDLDYINVPIVLKYYLVKKLNIQVGPQFGFLVNDDDLNSESMDIAGVVGIGLDLPLGFRIDGRYNFGLTEIFPDVSGLKNNVFSLSVGWSIL
ncbi:MAG: PorT family protein [Flavobacteriales bacterium]|nr:MAG: PorT family protein [Flavobacteriales bacterium]